MTMDWINVVEKSKEEEEEEDKSVMDRINLINKKCVHLLVVEAATTKLKKSVQKDARITEYILGGL